jgi:hypothetical protein
MQIGIILAQLREIAAQAGKWTTESVRTCCWVLPSQELNDLTSKILKRSKSLILIQVTSINIDLPAILVVVRFD